MKRDGPKESIAFHGPSDLKFLLLEKSGIQALFEAVDNKSPERMGSCEVRTVIHSLKLRKANKIDGIPNECLRQLPRRSLVHLTHLLNHFFRLSHFLSSWKEAKL
jgi:hypothetical protein